MGSVQSKHKPRKPTRQKGRTKSRWAGWATWGGIALFCALFAALPALLARVFGLPAWQGRTISLGVIVVGLPVGALLWSLHPRSIVLGRKTAPRRKVGPRSRLEWTVRGIGVLFSIFFAYVLTLPYLLDAHEVHQRQTPVRVSGEVTLVTRSRTSASVTLIYADPPKNDVPKGRYTFFALPTPKEGDNVELLVLPRSKLAVDWRPFASGSRRANAAGERH